MKPCRRAAFTLFELLVILALLALLFALLLPSIVRARAQALREQRLNNLKQIALACHNHNDVYAALPAGNDQNNFSAAAKLLPFVEQDNLYKQIDFKKPIDDPANAAIRGMPLPVFLSPNDPRMSVTKEYGATNYLFNAGTKYALVGNDGVFFQDSKSRIPATFQDGTSLTIMIGETLKGDAGTKPETVQRQHVELGKDALKRLKPGSGVAEWKESVHIAGDRCSSWMDGHFLQGTFNGARLPNDERPDVDCGGLGGQSALRGLDHEVGVAMGDGSARRIKDKINAEVWKALLTPAGGEMISSDF
jgi:type II secretory pathway pseudopilin PulG